MKTLTLFLALIIGSFTAFSQKNDAKAMEILKQIQNPNGKIMLVIEGKTYTEAASLIKVPNGKYFISSDMTSAKNLFSLIIANKETGTYELSKDKKENTVFVLSDNDYQVKSGTVKLKNSGGKISGTYTGLAQKYIGKKNIKKPQGNLIPFSGSFSGLSN